MNKIFNSVDKPNIKGNEIFSGIPKRKLQYPLTEVQLKEYQDKGFVILKEVFSKAEMDFLSVEADDLQNRGVELCKKLGYDPEHNLRVSLCDYLDKRTAWKIDPFSSWSPIFSSFLKDRRICDKLATIYDGHEPLLFKDKLIYKPPGSDGNALHQDYNWWQGFPNSLISICIPLDKTTKENGCTELYTGYQRGFLHQEGKMEGLEGHECVKDEQLTYAELNPGDIAIFNCLVPHEAKSNTSENFRRAMFITYNDSRDGEFYNAHYRHYHWYITRYLDKELQSKKYFF